MDTTVLLVDDEPAFIETMRKRLTRRNLKVLSAGDGAEALELLSKQKNINVVILDVRMPGMGGMEILRQIKAGYPGLEVILLTGHATMESALTGMKLGAFDYLTKPCSIEQVYSKVIEATKQGK